MDDGLVLRLFSKMGKQEWKRTRGKTGGEHHYKGESPVVPLAGSTRPLVPCLPFRPSCMIARDIERKKNEEIFET